MKVYITTWNTGQFQAVHTSLKKAVAATTSYVTKSVLQPNYGKRGRDALAIIPSVTIYEYETDNSTKFKHGAVYGKPVWPKPKDIELIWLGKRVSSRERIKGKYPN